MKKPAGFPLFTLIAALLIISMASCVTQKQVKYLQKKQELDTVSIYQHKKGADYKLTVNDELYIKVYPKDEKSYYFFNRESTNVTTGNDYTEVALYLNSYTVDEDGSIEFPVIGKITVAGMTPGEVKKTIQEKIGAYLTEASVVVKIVSFRITVLGEVKQPGEKKIYQEQMNIFEALSLAGDMTDFADRGKVALIRQTENGSRVIYLNMNSSDILLSQYYNLMPNDIIYVAPLGIKRWGSETFPWGLAFAAITTALLLMNYFK